MIKFITKMLLATLIIAFGAGSVNAQELIQKSANSRTSVEGCAIPVSFSEDVSSFFGEAPIAIPKSLGRAGTVVFSEGFEGTTTSALPAGWTATPNPGTAGSWQATNNGMVTHNSLRGVGNFYGGTGARNAWAYTPGFTLTQGVTYTVQFWLRQPGYLRDEFDKFEVKIGQTASPTGMTDELYVNTDTRIYYWTPIVCLFTPTATGTYHLGFHSFTPAGEGDAIGFDDVSVRVANPNDLLVNVTRPYPYTQVPQTQTLLPSLSAQACNIGSTTQNNVQLAINYNGTTLGTSAPTTLAPAGSVNFAIPTSSPAIPAGANTLTYTVSQSQTDDDPSDNTATYTFQRTGSTYAVDNNTMYWVLGANNANTVHGNVYTFAQPTKLCQVKYYSYAGNTTNLTLGVYPVTGDLNDIENVTVGTTSVIPTQTVSKPNATNWQTVNITGMPTIPAGTYFVSFAETSTNQPMYVLADNNYDNRVGFQRSGDYLIPNYRVMMMRLEVDLNNNDITVDADCPPYSKIPESQAIMPFPSLTSRAYNAGLLTQNNIKFNASFDGTPLGQSPTVIASLASFATSAVMTITSTGTNYPTTPGNYDFVYNVSQDQTDENPTDNTTTFTVKIGGDTYALDGIVDPTNGVGSNTGTISAGNIFNIYAPVTLTNVEFGIGSGGKPYTLSLFPVTGTTLSGAAIFTTATQTTVSGFQTVAVPETELTPGDYYLCINQTAGGTQNDNISLSYDIRKGARRLYTKALTGGSGTALTAQADFGAGALRMVLGEGTPPPPDCYGPTNLVVDYATNCNTAQLTWTAPIGKGKSTVANELSVAPAKAAFDNQYIEAKKATLQNRGARAITKPAMVSAPPSKGVIFYEGFEGSSGYDLPSTWTLVNYGDTDDWGAYEEDGYAVDGIYVMSHDDYYDDRDAWAFSPGFTLTAGVTYGISFYLNMPGYGAGDYDAMEVKIGQAKTATGMTHLVYQKLYEPTGYWDLIEQTFTPTITGTYYLGFHAMTEAWGGDYIDVDAILVTDDVPVPLQYNVYCDGTKVNTTPITGTTFTIAYDLSTTHTWGVTAICEEGGESDPATATKDVCDDNDPCLITTLPWKETFNDVTFPPDCWVRYAVTGATNWQRSTATPLHDGGYAYRAFASGNNQETWLVTPPISIPATGNYRLEFMSYIEDPSYYFGGTSGGNGRSKVWISTTTNNRPDFTELYFLQGDDVATAWQKIIVALSAYNGENVYLAFVYTGNYDHGWRVDDVAVVEVPDNDLVITAVYPYTQVPETQTLFPTLSATVTNNGAATQTNLVLNVTLNGTIVGTTTLASLAPGASATMTVTTSGVAIPVGENELTYTVTQDQQEVTPADNTVTRTFTGTDYTFATDNGNIAVYFGATTANTTFGNIYTFTTTTTLHQVMANFYNSAATNNQNLTLSIFAMTGATTINTTALYTQTVAKPQQSTSTLWVAFNLTTAQTLPAGSYYISLTEQTSNRNMALLGDANGEGRVGYQRSGTTANLLAQSGALFLRLTVDLKANDIQSVANGFPYTQIPASQAANLPFPTTLSGRAYNAGYTAQTNVTLSVEYNGTPMGTSTPIANLAALTTSAVMNVTTPAGTVFPTTLGTNNVVYTVSQDQTDETPANNTETYSFDITDYIYAIDGPIDITSGGVGYNTTPNARLGNYFTITDLAMISQVMAAFNNFNPAYNLSVKLYNCTGALTIAATPLFTQTFVKPAAGGWQTIDVPATLLLPGTYFLCIQQASTGENAGILFDGIPSRVCYGVGDGTGTTLTQQTGFGSLAIRMVLTDLPPVVTITTAVDPVGAGTVTGAGTYIENTTVTLTAYPNIDYVFVEWQDGNTDNPRTIVATEDATYTAYFAHSGCAIKIAGTGAVNQYVLPINTFYGYSYSQQIFMPEEVGPAGKITKLAFKYIYNVPNVKNDQVYYLGNTTKSTFGGTTVSEWIPLSELTQVFAGDLVYDNANEWFVIEFDTPFDYYGCNLVLAVLNNHGAYTTGSNNTFQATSTTPNYRSLYYQKDNSPAGPINPGALPAASARSYNRSNTMFLVCPDGDLYPMDIPVATPATDVSCTSFVANWGTATDATNYWLSVYTRTYAQGEVVLEEDFSSITTGDNTSTTGSSVVWTGNANFPGLTSSANRVLQAGGAVRLGSGSGQGIMPSKALDLSGGPVTISFKVKGWTNVESPVLVRIDNGTPQAVTYTAVMASPEFEQKSITFPAATANSTVTFETAGTNLRYFLDDIEIYVAGAPIHTYVLNNQPTGDVTSYLVQNLIPGTTYYYTVKSAHWCMATDPSNEIEVATEPVYSIAVTTGANGIITPAGPVVTLGCGVTSQTFNFSANACYEIDQVLIDGVSTPSAVAAGTYTFNNVLDNTHSINVTFKILTYTLEASVNGGNGTITPSGTTTANCGSNYTYTFTPNTCYAIDDVLVDGVSNPAAIAAGSYTFTNVTANHTIEVSYVMINHTITASVDGENGTITPSGTATVNCGTTHTYTFTPDYCYEIADVVIDGVSNPVAIAAGFHTFSNVTANHTIEVSFILKEYDITVSAGANGSITPDESMTIDCGESQTFYFEADECYEIDNVLINGVSDAAAIAAGYYTFDDVTANQSISVTFKIKTFTITAIGGPNGTLEPAGILTYECGGEQTFFFEADEDFEISMLLIDEVSKPEYIGVGSYTFSDITENHSITVMFKSTLVGAAYTIIATSDNGATITPSGTVNVSPGENQKFTFAAKKGYELVEVWIDGVADAAALANGFYTFEEVEDDHTIDVISTELPVGQFVIHANYGQGGAISPNGDVYVFLGGSQTFTITPKLGYKIDKVWVNDVLNEGAIATGQYTFENVMEENWLTATFTYLTIEQHTINASVGTTGGTISPAGKITVYTGDDKLFTFTPQAGYKLKEVLVNGVNNLQAVEDGYYLFEDIMSSHTIVGKFEKKNYTISSSIGTAGGSISPVGDVTVAHGGSKAYTITALTGYVIDKVLINGENNEQAVTSGKYTFSNVSDNYTIVANFKYRTHDITATQGANGTVSPDGVTAVIHGNSITYFFTPDQGYFIKTVLVDGKNNTTAVSAGFYTFVNVTAKHTITATFAPLGSIHAEGEGTAIQLSLYPNPTTGIVQVNNGEETMENIQVFDMLGKMVTEYKVENEVAYQMDFTGLPGGVYFVKVKTATDVVIRKVVKQ